MHIAVLDDDQGRRIALSHTLASANIHVAFAGDLLHSQPHLEQSLLLLAIGPPKNLHLFLQHCNEQQLGNPIVLMTPAGRIEDLVPLLSSSVLSLLTFADGPKLLIEHLLKLHKELHSSGTSHSLVAAARRYFAILQRNHASGILHVKSEATTGQILLRAGRVVDGLCDTQRGEAAVASLLTHISGEVKLEWKSLGDDDPAHEKAQVLLPQNNVQIHEIFTQDGQPSHRPSTEELRQTEPIDVLLVDDEEDLRVLYSTALKHNGFSVRLAKDGMEALERIKEKRPDAILSDMMMPRLDGWGLLAKLRNDARYRETPFAFVSCHYDFLQQLESLQAGADAYISKGVRLDQFVQSLRDILAAHVSLAAHLVPGKSLSGGIGRLGPVTLIRQIASRNASGLLQIRDFWAQYKLAFSAGVLAHAEAQIGENRLFDANALSSLLGVRNGQWLFDSSQEPDEWTLGESALDVIERSCINSNTREETARKRLCADTAALFPRFEMFDFYQSVSLPGTQDILAMIRQGTTPRKILLAQPDQALLVDWIIQDLLQKRVVEFVETSGLS